ncbi:TonB-dependent receptor domain-containing protein [Aliagarivorans taiwanensis]|uniref:TonB-dependent receptor domain-containing protein n=1 Tax=Aliagarivorans taiwanensis TaxID=561966 RepID=UPI0004235CA8|nr:TonB-dependent receptor [Aliagarivorans taiwanensis]
MDAKKTLALAVAATLSHAVSAEQTSPDETFVVTASRFEQPIDSVIAPLTIIDRQQIEQSAANDLLDLLAAQPGIQIARNGGRGQTGAIFIRGAASNQSVVLLNGTRLNSATNGTAQIGLLALDLIERVEIVRGARASIYGADVIGGVINIITRPKTGTNQLDLLLGAGSDDRYFGGVRAVRQIADTQLYLAANRDESKGYDFLPEDGASERYGYESNNLQLGLSSALTQELSLDLSYLYQKGEADFDANGRSLSEGRKHLVDAALEYRRSAWFSKLMLNYMDDRDKSTAPSWSSLYSTQRSQAHWLGGLQLNPNWLLQAGAEWKEDDVSESVAGFTDDKRINRAVHAGLMFEQGPYNAELGLRYDDNSDYGSDTNYNLGASAWLGDNWKILALHSTAFRAPNFNELYNPWGGNPTLNPEKATNYELGLQGHFSRFELSLNAYRNDIDDLISVWPIENIGRARITGVELDLGFETGSVDHRLIAEWMDPEDRISGNQLARRAKEKLTWQTGVSIAKWQLNGEWLWRGKAYEDAANTIEIDAYQLLNLSARYLLKDNWSVDAKLHNLLDEEYTTALGFAPAHLPYLAPGRSFELSTRYRF